MKFTYRSGQRPLSGYTLKRGVGQGGFGEVYFAVSDGGKEVALKLLHRHSDAELRGVAHCLNLKHPHLVHLYDLLADTRGDKWVVMEYVFGESLGQWINRYPTGLPGELVKEWFAALARAVTYLHDHGVVHRDLKPANIFVEHGHLKIGDYGLSRRLGHSGAGDLTRGIGTPHYMAPEIKSGNYTLSIDVYACGVILYEMLTGHPPFEGETPAEVLIKHQTDTPDLARVPAGFVPVIEKALKKNPADRYPNMKEFARAVEAVVIERAANPTAVTVTSIPESPPAPTLPAPLREAAPGHAPAPRPPTAAPPARPRFASGPIPMAFRERLTNLAGSLAFAPIITAVCTAPWLVFQSGPTEWDLLGRVFLLATAMSWAVLLFARPPLAPGRHWGRRLPMLLAGAGVGGLAFWLDGWLVPGPGPTPVGATGLAAWLRLDHGTFSTANKYLCFFGLTAAAVRWWSLTDRRRKERFRLAPVIVAGFWGSVLLFLWPWESASPALGLAPLVIAAVAVQVASPWSGSRGKA